MVNGYVGVMDGMTVVWMNIRNPIESIVHVTVSYKKGTFFICVVARKSSSNASSSTPPSSSPTSASYPSTSPSSSGPPPSISLYSSPVTLSSTSKCKSSKDPGILVILLLLDLLPPFSKSSSYRYSSSDPESAYVRDDNVRDSRLVLLRLSPLVDFAKLASLLLNLSKDDICFNSVLLSLKYTLSCPDWGRMDGRVFDCLLPARLKFRKREKVLWLGAAERAMRAGAGG